MNTKNTTKTKKSSHKLLVLSLMTLLLIGVIPLVSASVSLNANLAKYEPLPAEPGQYITVHIELENNGNDDAPNAAIRIQDQFPFTVVDKTTQNNIIGILKSQQSTVIDVKLRIDSNAVIGNNKLKILYAPDVNQEEANWYEKEFNIDVKSNDASLTISKVKIEPEEIAPGDNGLITLNIKNSAEMVLRDITIKPVMQITSTTTVVDLPFIPMDSVTEKKIKRLNPGELTSVQFPIKAYPTATPGYYKIPVSMEFYNDAGIKIEQKDVIGVIIKAVPELKIYLDNTKIATKGTSGDITLKFVNKGINDLKFLDVELLKSDDYTITSASKHYIGDLASDDYRSETFTITPKVNDAKIQVKVSYKDENNKAYETTESVMMRYDTNEGKDGKKLSGFNIFLIIIVLILVTYVIRKRRKDKRKK